MKKIISFLISLSIGVICFGQQKGNSEIYANWNLGSPVNNSFVQNFSASGGNLGYNVFIKNNLAIGAEAGWNNYNKYEPRQTYFSKTGAFTTDMYKYIFAVPVTATVTKYFYTGVLQPYVKIGAGTLYSEQNLYYNIYETTNSNWGFLAVPEVGLHVKTNKDNRWAFNAGAQYSYATNKNEDYNLKNIRSYSFNVGLNLSLH